MAYSQKQQFPNAGNRKRRVRNSELITSISGSMALSSKSYPLNPGLSVTFPWLSEIACQFQHYRFHSLRFRYVTRTGTSEKGSIILSPEYNPEDMAPTTEGEASNTQDAVEDVIWKDLICELDPSSMFPLGSRKLIRVNNIAKDLNLYDCGNMHVVTTGEDSSDEIGKLWVDYDVELFVPQSTRNDTFHVQNAAFFFQAAQILATTVPEVALSDSSTFVNTIPGLYESEGVYTFPRGAYALTYSGTWQDTDAEYHSLSIILNIDGSPNAWSIETNKTSTQPNSATSISRTWFLLIGEETMEVELVATGIGAGGTLKLGDQTLAVQTL